LNNLIEQDRRLIKKITKPMTVFKAVHSAKATLEGTGESLFLSKYFPFSQRGNTQKYRDKFKLLLKPQTSCSP